MDPGDVFLAFELLVLAAALLFGVWSLLAKLNVWRKGTPLPRRACPLCPTDPTLFTERELCHHSDRHTDVELLGWLYGQNHKQRMPGEL